MKDIGNLFGIDIKVSEFVPDNEVYVMNKKMLDSFTITDVATPTKWEKVKRYLLNLWLAVRGKL
jgi:myosin-crossreactive antigen